MGFETCVKRGPRHYQSPRTLFASQTHAQISPLSTNDTLNRLLSSHRLPSSQAVACAAAAAATPVGAAAAACAPLRRGPSLEANEPPWPARPAHRPFEQFAKASRLD